VAYVSGRDITAEKQAEQALRQESAFRKAMEDSWWWASAPSTCKARITYVNPSFCAITGYSEQELIGQAALPTYWRQGYSAKATGATWTIPWQAKPHRKVSSPSCNARMAKYSTPTSWPR
jgi:PAS domain-containing protein